MMRHSIKKNHLYFCHYTRSKVLMRGWRPGCSIQFPAGCEAQNGRSPLRRRQNPCSQESSLSRCAGSCFFCAGQFVASSSPRSVRDAARFRSNNHRCFTPSPRFCPCGYCRTTGTRPGCNNSRRSAAQKEECGHRSNERCHHRFGNPSPPEPV